MIVLYILLGAYLLFINIDAFGPHGPGQVPRPARRPPRARGHALLPRLPRRQPGIMLAMRVFRHKTLHTSFAVGMPLICFFEAVLIAAALIYAAT